LIKVFIEYLDYSNIFNNIFLGILVVYYSIEYRIDLEPDISLSWGCFYLLFESELIILQEYLKSNKIKGWIWKSISLIRAPIIFVRKKKDNLKLYINYYSLNITTIKNRISLFFIGKIFIKLDLKDTYYKLRIREKNK
jgi:hypothetical protein